MERAIKRAERAAVRVGKDGFAAVPGDGAAQAMGDFVERLVPGDALEAIRLCRADTLVRVSPRSFRSDAPHRIKHTIGRIDSIKIFGNFGAEKSLGDRVLGIALNFGGASVFDGDQDAAGIGTVVRAGGVDDALHPRIIERFFVAPFRSVRSAPRTSLASGRPSIWPTIVPDIIIFNCALFFGREVPRNRNQTLLRFEVILLTPS